MRSVTRQVEPEWDSYYFGLVLGLDRYDNDCCPGCGLHKDIVADPDRNRFEFDESHCSVCAAQALKQRLLAETDEDWDTKHKDAPARRTRPSDGRHVRLRQLSPLEVLQRETKRP